MNETQRKTSGSTKWNILKRKPIPLVVGLLMTLMSAFILMVFSSYFITDENEIPKINYDLISEKGMEIDGTVTDVVIKYNLTINGVHPAIISYKYLKDGKEVKSKFQTLSERKTEDLEIGQEIQIIEYKGNSIIADFEPFDMPIGFIFLILFPHLLIGLSFLVYCIVQLKKELKLYKFGKIMNAKIIILVPVSSPVQGFVVHYEYDGNNGRRMFGHSFTTDFTLLSSKKNNDLIPIFVSNDNEEKSCVVPKKESLRNNWNVEFLN